MRADQYLSYYYLQPNWESKNDFPKLMTFPKYQHKRTGLFVSLDRSDTDCVALNKFILIIWIQRKYKASLTVISTSEHVAIQAREEIQ